MSEERCRQAWHAGLRAGLLRECKYESGHRGSHRDEQGDLAWGGRLTAAEMATADALRATTP